MKLQYIDKTIQHNKVNVLINFITIRTNDNKVYEDIYFVVLDGLINILEILFTEDVLLKFNDLKLVKLTLDITHFVKYLIFLASVLS